MNSQNIIREVALIDGAISDLDTLIAGLRPGVAAVLLDATMPAPAQIARVLADRRGLNAIHIISHGAVGEVRFAAGPLSLETIDEHRADLAAIGRALGDDGDLRLWSCATGRGGRGAAFVAALAGATGAEVAAASGRVGASERGGRWVLETRRPAMPALPPLTVRGQAAYAGALDIVTGTNGTNTISSTLSNSTIADGNGSNTVTVSGNNDTVTDGNGSNTVTVSGDNETVTDGNGNNTVTVSGNNETVTDGNGSNTVVVSGGGTDHITDGNGSNLIYAAGTTGTNTITDGNGSNIIVGGSGNDTITDGNGSNIIYGGAGNDIIKDGNGSNVVIAGAGSDMVTTGNGSDLAIYAVSDHYTVQGSGTNATLVGTGDTDQYNAGGGNDTLRIVVSDAEYQLTSVQQMLADYATWLKQNKGTNQTYYFNFATGAHGAGGVGSLGGSSSNGTSGGLVVGGWEALQIEVVNPGIITLAPGAGSASGSLADLHLFADSTTSTSAFATSFKVVGAALGVGNIATSLDPSLAVAQYLDGSTALPASYTVNGVDGALTVYSNGTYNYSVTSRTASTDTFTITTLDQNGFVTATTVTFGVPVVNHAPTISAGATMASGAFAERAGQTGDTADLDSAAGSIAFADVDLNDTHTLSQSVAASWSGGALSAAQLAAVTPALSLGESDSTRTGSGTVGWSYSAADSNFDFLAAGETLTLSYQVTVTDNHGASANQLVTVTITGTDDAPVITSAAQAGSVTELANTSGSATADTAAGAVTFTDLDLTDTHTAGFAAQGAGYLGAFSLDPLMPDSTNGVTGSVGWHFSVADGALDYLAAGQQLTQKYDVTVDDGHGGTATQTVTVTITGTDDAPAITSAAQAGSVTELANTSGSATADTAAGAVTFTDLDLTDTHTAGFAAQGAGYLGAFSLDPLMPDSTNGVTGSVGWHFSVADGALDYLAAGQQLTQKYDVTVDDGHGGTATQTVTVTITGTDDAPAITSAAQAGSVTELANTSGSATADTAAGAVTFTDLDLTDTHTAGFAAQGAGYLGAFSLDPLMPDSTNGVTGSVGWHFSVADGALDYLAAGQQLTQKYDVTVDDGHGGTATQTVTVTITGTDDAPAITSAAQAGSVTELANTSGSATADTAAGAVTFTDLDLTDTHTAGFAAQGAGYLGAFSLDPLMPDSTNGVTGSVGWHFSVADGALDYLAAGQQLTQKYDVTVDDGHGGTATQTVTVTITGTDDAPVITSAAQAGSVTELANTSGSATADTAAGAVTFTDLDLTDTHTAGFAAQGAGYLGAFSLDPLMPDSTNGVTGSVGWHFSVADGALDYLAAGQQLTQKYDVTVDDGHGGTATQTVTVTITGTDDAPAITSAAQAGSVTELANTSGSATADTAAGAVTFTDLDLTDTHTAGFAAQGAGYLGAFSLDPLMPDSTNGVTGSVGWHFSVADGALDYLAAGQQLTQKYDVTVDDGHGGTATQTVTVTITGTDDAPAITSAAQAGSVTELANTSGSATADTAAGAVTFTDLDLTDTHTAGFAAQGAGYLGAFSLDPLMPDSTNGVTGSVGWHFSVADGALDYLAAGQQLTQKYDVTVDDGHGGTATQTVTVTITGTDDAPAITSAAQAGSVTELANTSGSATADTAAGAVTFTDLDLTDTHTAGFAAQGAGYLGAFSLDPLMPDSTNGVTGSVGWHFSVADGALDYLAAGQQLTQKYDVTVDDGHGGTATQTVTVTITGTDDAPAITSAAQAGSVTELANTSGSATADTAAGAVTFTDLDLTDTHTAGFAAQGAGYLGAFSLDPLMPDSTNGVTGSVGWHFSVADGALDYLAAGQQLTQKYDVTVDDGHGGTATQTVTVTITGTDDAPVITSAAQAGSVTELANTSGSATADTAAGAVTFTDLDLTDTHTAGFAAQGAGYLGAFSLDPLMPDSTNGVTGSVGWHFSVADGALDYLAAGQQLTQKYDVTVDDGHGGTATQTVTVTITGTDDAPAITSAAQAGSVTELANTSGSATADTAAGAVTFTDLDLTDTHTAGFAAQGAGYLGAFSLDPLMPDSTNGVTGSVGWHFSVADGALDYLAAGQQLTQKYDVTVDDGHGGTATQTVTVTITGTDDAPAITSAAQAGSVTELANTSGSATADTAAGAVTFTDLDLTDTHTAGFAAQGAGYLGAFSLDPLMPDSTNGVTGSVGWHFSVADGALDYLAAGQQLTQKYDVTVDDGHGGTATQTVTVTITGTDDAPAITSAAQAGSVTELANTSGSATADTAAGAVTFTDLDLTDTHTAGFAAQGAGYLGAFSLDPLMPDSTNGVTGSVGWHFSVADGALDYLAAGQQLTQKYDVTVDDGHGGTATQTVTVTITGTDDAPVITSAAQAGSVTELANTSGSATADTAAGAVTFTDLDLTDTHTAGFAAQGAGYLGAFSLDPLMPDSTNGVTGSVGWHFSVADGALDYLAAGQQLTQKYDVTVDDGHGGTATQTVTVTITGTDDAPAITSAAQAGSVTELANTSGSATADTAAGAVTFTDLDLTDTHTAGFAAQGAGYLGAFSLDPLMPDSTNGVTGSVGWHFSVADGALDYLAAGQQLTQKYDVTVDDGHGGTATQTVTVTITGTDDAPVVAANSGAAGGSLSYTENQAATAIDTALTLADVDSPNLVGATVKITGNFASGQDVLGFTNLNGISGSYSTGVLTLAGSSSVANYQTALRTVTYANTSDDPSGATRTISFQVDDGSAFNHASNIDTTTVTVTPVNDAPVNSVPGTQNVHDNTNLVFSSGNSNLISVSDLNSEGGVESVTLGVVHGTLTLGATIGLSTVSGNGTGAVSMTGTVAALNTALGGLTYKSVLNFNSNDQLTITTNDQGHTGSGGAQSDTDAVTITVHDATAPTLTTVALHTPATSPTNADSLVFEVTFSETVTGVGTADFAVGGTTATATAVTPVNGSVYDVTVSGGNLASLNGTVGLGLSGSATVQDTAGNALTNFTTTGSSASYVEDNTADAAPTLLVSSVTSSIDSSNFTAVTLTVTGFDSDIASGTITLTDQHSHTATHTLSAGDISAADNTGQLMVSTFTNLTTLAKNDTISALISVTDSVGNSSSHTGTFQKQGLITGPAGIAGSPVNLGLGDPSGAGALTAIAVSGVPSDWNLNQGTNNGDGTWTVQTSDPSSLYVTTPGTFAGATVLNVSESWTNADGSTGTAFVSDNVEAYPASPIFAVSGDDTLTGAGGNDQFVFAQPIGNDRVYDFNPASDTVDLIGFGIAGYGDLAIGNDGSGNAVVTVGAGETIALVGVDPSALSAGNFAFDAEPVSVNAGTMTIGDGALLPIGGTVANSGTIVLSSTGDGTGLEILVRGATLTGGGQVVLSDNSQNVVYGGDPSAVLDNVDNTISGAGRFGGGMLTLHNEGVIVATGANALVIDTATNVVVNSGTLKASGAGGLVVASAATGGGTAEIGDGSSVEFVAASDAAVGFDPGATGSLKLDQSASFSGTVAGFTGYDAIDLADLIGGPIDGFVANGSGPAGGTLMLGDVTHTISLALLGQYAAAADFTAAPDGHGGTLVTLADPNQNHLAIAHA